MAENLLTGILTSSYPLSAIYGLDGAIFSNVGWLLCRTLTLLKLYSFVLSNMMAIADHGLGGVVDAGPKRPVASM